jgi:hypothetical protein
MKHFTIDTANNITVHTSKKAARETDPAFRTGGEAPEPVAHPASRMGVAGLARSGRARSPRQRQDL